jgi:hypothetical protein
MEGVHPTGIVVDIVGTNAVDHGRSCEIYACCREVLKPNLLLRYGLCQVIVDGKEEPALAVYWVSEGMDCCRVGFLRWHLLKHKEDYHGKLAQIVDVFTKESESPSDRQKVHRSKGCCQAVLVDLEEPTDIASPTRKRKAPDEYEAADKASKEDNS